MVGLPIRPRAWAIPQSSPSQFQLANLPSPVLGEELRDGYSGRGPESVPTPRPRDVAKHVVGVINLLVTGPGLGDGLDQAWYGTPGRRAEVPSAPRLAGARSVDPILSWKIATHWPTVLPPMTGSSPARPDVPAKRTRADPRSRNDLIVPPAIGVAQNARISCFSFRGGTRFRRVSNLPGCTPAEEQTAYPSEDSGQVFLSLGAAG